jgi:uncharacterized membrane protein
VKILLSLILLVILGGGVFYWIQIRPGRIKAECNEWAMSEEKRQVANLLEVAKQGRFPTDLKEYETLYNQCLREKGI